MMQDQPGNADSRPPGALEAMQAIMDKVEALCLTNQRLIEELERLTRQVRRPREAQQIQEGHDVPPMKDSTILILPEESKEAESSRARGHGPRLAPEEEGNEATPGGHVGNEELRHP